MNAYWSDVWTELDWFLQLVEGDVVVFGCRLSSFVLRVVEMILYPEYVRADSLGFYIQPRKASKQRPFHQFAEEFNDSVRIRAPSIFDYVIICIESTITLHLFSYSELRSV